MMNTISVSSPTAATGAKSGKAGLAAGGAAKVAGTAADATVWPPKLLPGPSLALRACVAAAAAAIRRLARRREVRPALIFVDRRDLRLTHARIGALVAADGEGAIAGPDRIAGRSYAGRPHAGGANADEGDITIEIVSDELT